MLIPPFDDAGKMAFGISPELGIFPKGFIPKGKPSFQSKIDWGKWNSEIPNNKALLDEYYAIEKATKANGTWMVQPREYSIFSEVDEINLKGLKDKLAKGELRASDIESAKRIISKLENQKFQSTIFQGTPEQFVQQNSKNFKNHRHQALRSSVL